MESWSTDEHRADKVFFILIQPVNGGRAGVATMHRDSVGGPLIRRAVARTRARVAELLGARERDGMGPMSVLEMPVVFARGE